MQVFLYEFFSGGGLWSLDQAVGPVESLLREGAAMACALAEDLACVSGVEVTILRDIRFSDWHPTGCRVLETRNAEEDRQLFQRGTANSDWTAVIAPEFEDILLRRCREVESGGGRLLGPCPEVVALASDKRKMSQYLANAGIPVPAPRVFPQHVPGRHGVCTNAFDGAGRSENGVGLVLKPRKGAGSMGIRWIRDLADLPDSIDSHQWCLEQWCPGRAASVSWIAKGSTIWLLEPCFQRLSSDGQFRYEGGSAPLPEPLRSRAQDLAWRVARSLPSSLGYLGTDLVLGEDAKQDVVIEVNPRLTTSYLGLRKMARGNIAEAILAAAEGRDVELSFSRNALEFDAGESVISL